MENLIEQLFNDYCHYRERTFNYQKWKQDKPFVRPMKLNSERRDLLDQLIRWCNDKQLPVRQWLYSLFAVRRWMYAPMLNRSHLCSMKHLGKFQEFNDYAYYNKYIGYKTVNIEEFDIVTSVEDRKRELLLKGGGQLCMSFMATETFGFHPKSYICNNCNDKFECAKRVVDEMGFKVLQLRGH